MANQHIAQAKRIIAQLVKTLNISQVVFVDDVFSVGRPQIEQVLGYFTALAHQNPDVACTLFNTIFNFDNDDILRSEFIDCWSRLSKDAQWAKFKEVMNLLGVFPSADFELQGKLLELFPSNLKRDFLAPSEWQKRKEAILERVSENSRLLCLFDQDLSAEPEFSSDGPRSGGGLLRALLENVSNNVFCGILSHKIPDISEERNYRSEFSATYELDLQRFLPLAKARIQDESLLQLVDGIKKVVLTTFSEPLKKSIVEILQKAHEQAIKEVEDLDVYTFDRIVLRHYKGGEWEADTIVRVFQIFQRDAVKELLLGAESASKFNQTVLAARPVSKIETLEEVDVYPRVRSIRRRELYEKHEIVQHTPIQVGDIFVKPLQDKSSCDYILLAQPCDLAVRANGSRSGHLVPLIPIQRYTFQDESGKHVPKKWREFWSTRTVLDNYFEDSNCYAILEFKKAEWISTNVLDLCVLNSDGYCRIDFNNLGEQPLQITGGWQQLLKKLVEQFKEHRERLDKHNQHAKDLPDLWKSLMPKLCLTDFLPTESYENGIFDFKLQRIGRFRQPGSDALLKQFTQFLSRDAKEFDFSE